MESRTLDLARAGHIFVPATQMRARLASAGSLRDWDAFCESWNRLEPDPYMQAQGRCRYRRHAVFTASPNGIALQAHQPHYQSPDYNPLYGGIERWFEPLEPAICDGDSLRTILRDCHAQFGTLHPGTTWRVEVHQFRIEATPTMPGLPTPEGVHRDGVHYVLVLLIARHNVVSGTTTIHAPDGTTLGSFTLTEPFDAMLIDDERVHHGVTPITPLDASVPAYRDVLVVTFKRS